MDLFEDDDIVPAIDPFDTYLDEDYTECDCDMCIGLYEGDEWANADLDDEEEGW